MTASTTASHKLIFLTTMVVALVGIALLAWDSVWRPEGNAATQIIGKQQPENPSRSAASLPERVAPSSAALVGRLHVIVTGRGRPLPNAVLLRPGAEGLVAKETDALLGVSDAHGACSVALSEVAEGGFGVVADGYQAKFVAPTQLQMVDRHSGGELTVSLLDGVALTVACKDPTGAPLVGCQVTVCRSGALRFSSDEATEPLRSLDARDGQHVAWTDASGLATLSELASTVYYVRAEKAGFCATEAGTGRCLTTPPGFVTFTMAPIEVVRGDIRDGGKGFLYHLTNVRQRPKRISSLGALEAARRQESALVAEKFWATMDLAGGTEPASETLTVLFANGSRRVVELPYQRLAESRATIVAPGEDQPVFDVEVVVASAAQQRLPVKVRIVRFAEPGSRFEFDVAVNLVAPCKLSLPNGKYGAVVTGANGKWFEQHRYEISNAAATVRLESEKPLVALTFKREVPRGYLPGLWNIQVGPLGGKLQRHQCSSTENHVTVLAEVGHLRYIVNAPGLKDLDSTIVVPNSGVPEITVKQDWE